MPSFDGGDNFVWVGGPCEGFWLIVMLGEEAVDGRLEGGQRQSGRRRVSDDVW